MHPLCRQNGLFVLQWLRNRVALPGILALSLAGCEQPSSSDVERELSHEEYRAGLIEAGLGGTALGSAWLEAGESALTAPEPLVLPLAMQGVWLAHTPDALGLIFDGVAGRPLRLSLATTPLDAARPEARVFVELFAIESGRDGIRRRPVDLERLEDGTIATALPRDGSYVLRLQPELLASLEYELTVELGAALVFPVEGYELSAIRSVFGDPRDAGSRSHEGVDIFAARSTPVIAVADGRAVPRENRLGGNVVWLRAGGRSYYYAHLEDWAIDGTTRVRTGDVLGYIGNTGNARTTPPHLHFGVYARGAVDPLPYLVANELGGTSRSDGADFDAGFVRITAERLNVRSAPSRDAPVLEQFDRLSIAQTVAASGEWLRVRLDDRRHGWIHSGYQTALEPRDTRSLDAPGLLVDSRDAGAVAVTTISAGTTVSVLAEESGAALVAAGDRAGWYRPLPSATIDAAIASQPML